MSAFGIFALILTTAYIIYFLVMIARDIATGRKTADDNSTTETFDTSFMDEQSVEVSETENGFAIGEEEVAASPIIEVISAEPDSEPTSTSSEEPALQEKLDNEAMPLDVEEISEACLDDEEMYNTLQGKQSSPNYNLWLIRTPADNTESADGDGCEQETEGRDEM